MSGKYATPLHLDIGPSRLLGGWVILVHGMPLLMWPVLQSGSWLVLAVFSALLFSLVRSWRLQVSRHHPDAVCSMVWRAEKDCLLGLHSGEQAKVSMRPRAFILPWLVILHFNSRQRRMRHLVLLPDMLDREVFRKLRVRLKVEINRT
ncbi:MAG TPA: hypothetical protein DCO71_06495 [Gammaproteobacteria bacterium]|nr:hypothetical protein [Gammaproteobacteria bacterium]